MKKIPGLSGYYVTKNGSVFSQKKNGFLIPRKHSLGYLRVQLNGKDYYIHRLVMRAFIGESKLQVNHKNGNKEDNRLINLEYCSQKDNSVHAWKTGLYTHLGENHHKSYLSERDVEQIFMSRNTPSSLAKRFGATLKTIYNIKAGISWMRVTESLKISDNKQE